MRFDALILLVIDGTYREIALEFLEGLFDFGEWEVELPSLSSILCVSMELDSLVLDHEPVFEAQRELRLG